MAIKIFAPYWYNVPGPRVEPKGLTCEANMIRWLVEEVKNGL